MVIKLLAAQICMAAGCNMVIAPGHADNPLKKLLNHETPLHCTGSPPPTSWWQRASAGSRAPWRRRAALLVNSGAVEALHHGKSLLPAVVTAASKAAFDRGVAVPWCKDAKGPNWRTASPPTPARTRS